MSLILTRELQEHKDGTFGVLTMDGRELCKTVEKRWHNNQQRLSCIPQGTYHFKKRISEKYGHHWHIYDVEGRDLILIHNANWAHELLGCIGVGRDFAEMKDEKTGIWARGVTSSKLTMKKLRSILPEEGVLIVC